METQANDIYDDGAMGSPIHCYFRCLWVGHWRASCLPEWPNSRAHAIPGYRRNGIGLPKLIQKKAQVIPKQKIYRRQCLLPTLTLAYNVRTEEDRQSIMTVIRDLYF